MKLISPAPTSLICILGAILCWVPDRTVRAQAPPTFKLAYFNIQSGRGEQALPGHSAPFTENANCTDASQPLNAWGVGLIQKELQLRIAADPAVVALGLGEAWECATPAKVKQALGWAAVSSEQNGVAIVARYGFAGPEQWFQLDTSGNLEPKDTMWVLRVPVCLDAACTRSVLTFTAHWYSDSLSDFARHRGYEVQARQSLDAMAASTEPHVFFGDLNVHEGTAPICQHTPVNEPLRMFREAGYLDAWRATHADAEGYTGMWNRPACGSPPGYLWKRIDYSLSKDLNPISMIRFGMVPPGDGALSDHAGIIAEYALQGAVPGDAAPAVAIQHPDGTAAVSGLVTVKVAAVDDVSVARVELLVDGVVTAISTSAPFDLRWDTRRLPNGAHLMEAAATDSAGNRSRSSARQITIANEAHAGDEVVLYARDAVTRAGRWMVVDDPTAAGGARLETPDAGLARVTSALSNPADYFELTFNANAGTAYRLWVRGVARANDPNNASLHVQFDKSINDAGGAVFRIGTAGSAVIDLRECTGCPLDGWGWQDTLIGRDLLGPLVYFATTGTQRVRIQRRDDGMGVDQIVLSSVLYPVAAPGAPSRDSVILPRNDGTVPPPPNPSSLDEIVLYAAPPLATEGNWTLVADAGAAGGARVQNADLAAPKLAVPLAMPAHYFDLTFQAAAGRPYRLWMRGKALNNQYTNDSVYVQFDGAVNATGAPFARIATTEATTVILEEGSGQGVSGWGWADNGYGIAVMGPVVYFRASGTQRLRVQAREDGIGIDQIVLSAVKYLNVSPGATKNDTTILAPLNGGSPPPPPTPSDVILYAAHAAAVAGSWQATPDATAAGGVRMQNPDASLPKLSTPLAAPATYFDLTFAAVAGKPYRLWIRGKAERNSYVNDSVFVQFDGSVDASGAPIWRIGTASATTYVLEEGSGAVISNWGWQDNGYGYSTLGPVVYFAASGLQRIRIQAREDGLAIDQVVLSPGRFLSSAPGAIRDDTTVLPR